MKNRSKVLVSCISLLLAVTVGAFAGGSGEKAAPKSQAAGPEIPTIPQETVRAVLEPYYVCSAASIGLQKGWFEELGIKFAPAPYGTVVTGGDTVQYLASKKADMVDQPSVQVLGAIKDLPPIKTFVYDSVFYGYVLLGQPGSKTLASFVAQGLSKADALKQVMQQVKGKRFGYAGDAVALSFVTAALAKGNLGVHDVELSVFGDPENVSMMLSKQLDFVGGIGFPAAQELMSKGMVPIVSSVDIVAMATPSADSPELTTAFPVGWTTYDSYIKDHHDLLLRFSSVVWRVSKFVKEHPDEAAAIHLPFINSISGSRNTTEQIKSAYDLFDPWVTFEEQDRWFNDPTYPLYYKYSLGAYINDWVNKKYLKAGEVKLEDISIADKIYNEALKLKGESATAIKDAGSAIQGAGSSAKADALKQATDLTQKAQYFYDNYDYLDAVRFAKAASDWAKYAVQK